MKRKKLFFFFFWVVLVLQKELVVEQQDLKAIAQPIVDTENTLVKVGAREIDNLLLFLIPYGSISMHDLRLLLEHCSRNTATNVTLINIIVVYQINAHKASLA